MFELPSNNYSQAFLNVIIEDFEEPQNARLSRSSPSGGAIREKCQRYRPPHARDRDADLEGELNIGSTRWSIEGEFLDLDRGKLNATSSTKSPFLGNPTPVFYSHSLSSTAEIARIGFNYNPN
ncbi:hypothetical protein [Bradyrhizobium sp.]|uniref:hypothetical protein n=1 Tax=Bradyrhizobium sp. TaxID=376 RepID=UPI003C726F75